MTTRDKDKEGGKDKKSGPPRPAGGAASFRRGVSTVVKWRLKNGVYKPLIIDNDGNLVEVDWAAQQGSQAAFLDSTEFEILYSGTRGGCGKRISLSTRVLTDSGWKEAGQVDFADKLVSVDGSYTSINGIFPAKGNMNRIVFDDGAEVEADDDHLWKVYGHLGGKRGRTWQVRNTASLIGLPKRKWHIPLLEAPAPGVKWGGYDPYIIGCLIGDGTMSAKNPIIYTPEPEIQKYLLHAGWTAYEYPVYRRGGVMQMTLLGNEAHTKVGAPHEIGDKKYVPPQLLAADPASRLAVLQGLMDTDGHCEKNGNCRFTTVSEQLAEDVQYLARSLGGKASISVKKFKVGGYSKRESYFVVRITHAGKFKPFRLSRHLVRLNPNQAGSKRRIISITPCGMADGVCFAVDHPSQLFVVQDFIVTHNTDALLMAFAMDVGKGWGVALKGIIVRQQHPMLKELIAKSKRWFPSLFPGSEYNEMSHTWKFPEGETLIFDHLIDTNDFRRYLGHEYTFIGFEELVTWVNLESYNLMFSCLRSPIPGIPLKIRSTTNPWGPAHNEIKERFRIAERMNGEILGPLINDELDERGQKLPPRRAIFGHVNENKLLLKVQPNYINTMIPAGASEDLVRAWRDGDWSVTSGGMIGDIWAMCKDYILVPEFIVPPNWIITRSYDHGSSDPFCCLWFAKSNGEDLTFPDGKVMHTRKGDLFLIDELYGCDRASKKKGLNLGPHDIVKRIIQMELEHDWRKPDGTYCRVRRGPADTQIWAEQDGRPSIVNLMEQYVHVNGTKFRGIIWEQADKVPGSRKQGYQMLRERLFNTKPIEGLREFPGLFICKNCTHWIRTTPGLQRDPDDLDEILDGQEDHCFLAGTSVDTQDGPLSIENLPTHGYVHSVSRLEPYRNPRVTRRKAPIVQVTFADGRKVYCTPDERFLVGPHEWCYAHDLVGRQVQCSQSLLVQQYKSSMEYGTTSVDHISSTKAFAFIAEFGNTIRDLFQKVITCTINGVGSETEFAISNASLVPSTAGYTVRRAESVARNSSLKPGALPQNGMGVKKVVSGILDIMTSIVGQSLRRKFLSFVRSAVTRTESSLGRALGRNSVVLTAVKATCVGVEKLPGLHEVHCLTVPTNETFSIEGGLLVGNCADATRYRLRYHEPPDRLTRRY